MNFILKTIIILTVSVCFSLGLTLTPAHASPVKSVTKYVHIHMEFNKKLLTKVKKATNKLKKGDTLVLIINSPGGYVSVLYDILEIVKDKELKLRTIVNNGYSAAGIINCHADEFIMNEDGEIMFHMPRYDTADGMVVISDSNKYDNVDHWYYYYMFAYDIGKCYQKGLITGEEVKRFLAGEDVFISGEEMQKRLDKMSK